MIWPKSKTSLYLTLLITFLVTACSEVFYSWQFVNNFLFIKEKHTILFMFGVMFTVVQCSYIHMHTFFFKIFGMNLFRSAISNVPFTWNNPIDVRVYRSHVYSRIEFTLPYSATINMVSILANLIGFRSSILFKQQLERRQALDNLFTNPILYRATPLLPIPPTEIRGLWMKFQSKDWWETVVCMNLQILDEETTSEWWQSFMKLRFTMSLCSERAQKVTGAEG